MPRARRCDLLSTLDDGQRSRVLGELLDSHPELREEARVIAEFIVGDVSAEDIAADVADRVTGLDPGDLGERAGARPGRSRSSLAS